MQSLRHREMRLHMHVPHPVVSVSSPNVGSGLCIRCQKPPFRQAIMSASSSPDEPDPAPKPLPDRLGGVAQLFDIELTEATPEQVTATIPVTPDHRQPFGQLHGGVSIVLAESAASVGAYLAAPVGRTAAGL